jgi:hypothetical protein
VVNSIRYAAAPMAKKWETRKRCFLAKYIPVVVGSNFCLTPSLLDSGFGTRVKLMKDEEPGHFQSTDPKGMPWTPWFGI